MTRKFLVLTLVLGFCVLVGACQARRDIEDDQASGDDRVAALAAVDPAPPAMSAWAA